MLFKHTPHSSYSTIPVTGAHFVDCIIELSIGLSLVLCAISAICNSASTVVCLQHHFVALSVVLAVVVVAAVIVTATAIAIAHVRVFTILCPQRILHHIELQLKCCCVSRIVSLFGCVFVRSLGMYERVLQ